MAVINEISKSFDSKAHSYEHTAKVSLEVGTRLLERLQYLKITPKYILDLGCGTGRFSRELAALYPKAHIIAIDVAPKMLLQARKKHTWRRKWSLSVADMLHLPFASGLFDLVFANQVIHWGSPLEKVAREVNRVMSPNGCFMFTTLGPDTFKEISSSWQEVNSYAHVNTFPDMHDVGDCLLGEYFIDPVMDMEWLTVHYESLSALLHGLKAQGAKNIHAARNPGLMGKEAWSKFTENYEILRTEQGKYPLTYEVLYGHAWKGVQQKTAQGVEAFIPVSSIKVRNQ